jgi:hypothetical protein
MSVDIVTGEAAHNNVAGMPANVLLYGDPGTSKSTDAVATFTRDGVCSAFVIPFEDGALKAPAARGLPVPAHPRNTVKSWPDLYDSFAWLSQNRQHFTAVILDGFSVLSTHLYKAAEVQHAGSKNKFAIPLQVRGQLLQVRQWLRDINLHSIVIAHPLPPGVQDGVFYQGGFSLSPKSLVGEFFGQLDDVLRVGYVLPVAQPLAQAAEPARVYFTGGTVWPENMQQPPDWRYWRTKNREGCNWAIVPADLGAFLRSRQPPYVGL